MLQTAVLGFPRIGHDRALKRATEAYWKAELSEEDLLKAAREIRKNNWLLQKSAGIDVIPSNDFSLYDHMLDMTLLLGAIPARYEALGRQAQLPLYFAMARGAQGGKGGQGAVSAMEMTKWFDTNYHYIVPEWRKNQTFKLSSAKPCDEFKEALALGLTTRPVLVGPVTYLSLGKPAAGKTFEVLELLEALLEAYVVVLRALADAGARSVQLDEPILATDLSPQARSAFKQAYRRFADKAPQLSIMLTAYFGPLGENAGLAASLPVGGIHLDLTHAQKDAASFLKSLPRDMAVSFGIVNGRNVWKNDLAASIKRLKPLVKSRGAEKCLVATSCSLLHSPLDAALEGGLDEKVKRRLAFSAQKLAELALIKKALEQGEAAVKARLQGNQRDLKVGKIQNAAVRSRMKRIRPADLRRRSPFKKRWRVQQKRLGLPLFPTTTIGSFPQTTEIRQARAQFKKGSWSAAQYEGFLEATVSDVVLRQEAIGLDVLVHGEPERNDMVEYFGEQLEGFAFTQHGWVQSYGSRYVKPPIIYGDVSRPKPMTVRLSRYAQSLTGKPVKGMLTGPITILQWSFVRDDQPRSETAKQIALAIRDEVLDLERAGIAVIQIDEPAIREGLPLRRRTRLEYLKWAVEAFQLAANGVRDETQIHTHMCYSEFNDIIRDIARMDADVISIETSRSRMELLDAFSHFRYPNQIGPGVYDIHSPRVSSAEEMVELLDKACRLLPARNIWVNPDCGLKTRGWEETTLSLKAMVAAAKTMRERFASPRKQPPACRFDVSERPQAYLGRFS